MSELDYSRKWSRIFYMTLIYLCVSPTLFCFVGFTVEGPTHSADVKKKDMLVIGISSLLPSKRENIYSSTLQIVSRW